MDSYFKNNSWGTEVTHARNESQRRVKITVEVPITSNQSILATGEFWTYTKNRKLFEKGSFVTVLYNEVKPTQFKLKYHI